jgi:glycolate oxidase FAD binding subunit
MNDVISTSQNYRGAIERAVGQIHVRDASADDAVDGVMPRWVVAPGSAAEAAGVLRVASENGLRVIPRGGGTKLDWGNPPSGADIILSIKRLDRVLEHAFGDMTTTVQAGCTVAEFNRRLTAHEQRLAVDPLWPEHATIGGILAVNDSGALRATFGALRDQLIGITVALADGTIARSGGKVVKNVAGFDLPKLFTGSFGTLGVIVEATFRLYACPKASRVVRFGVPDHHVLRRALTALNAKSSLTTGVQIEARSDGALSLVIHIEGLRESIDEKARRVAQAAFDAGVFGENSQCKDNSGGDRAARLSVGSAWADAFSGARPNRTESAKADPTEDSAGDSLSGAEFLFAAADACVSRISLLPTQWPVFLQALQTIATPAGLAWNVVGQAMGVGLLELRGLTDEGFANCLSELRDYLGKSEGSLVILRGSREVKSKIDAWPNCDSALPLMRRIKEQFDPNRILSPGRFMGGI